jgi:hypothetical protein
MHLEAPLHNALGGDGGIRTVVVADELLAAVKINFKPGIFGRMCPKPLLKPSSIKGGTEVKEY